jgi:uncharacterized protein
MNSPGESLDHEALRRYARRVGDRWPVERGHVGGSRVTGAERGPAFVVILVSSGFDGVPWLERVHQAESLWDAAEMGDRAEVHCYTPVEFERKLNQLPAVREAAEQGVELTA